MANSLDDAYDSVGPLNIGEKAAEEVAGLPEKTYAGDTITPLDYVVDKDGHVVYSGEDKERNPFHFTRSSGNDFSFKLGISHFEVPPTHIDVTEIYSNTAAAYAIRSKTSSKMAVGQRQKRVTIQIMFPDLNKAWEGPNSLRGLVAQFRSAPFLPVFNTYLNDVHGIDALALASLNVSTVPGHPYLLSAELVCYKFDWRSYVPYHGSFGGSLKNPPIFDSKGKCIGGDPGVFKWDMYQYYYDRARNMLDNYTNCPRNESGNSASVFYDPGNPYSADAMVGDEFVDWNIQDLPQYANAYDDALKQKFGEVQPDAGAKRMEIYYSDREYASMMWLNKLGAKKVGDLDAVLGMVNGTGKGSWTTLAGKLIEGSLLNWFFEDEAIDPLKASQQSLQSLLKTNQPDLTAQYNAFMALASMAQYLINHQDTRTTDGAAQKQQLLKDVDDKIEELNRKRPGMPPETLKQLALYLVVTKEGLIEKLLDEKMLQKVMKDGSTSWIHEWEIPMRRMGLSNDDLYHTVIVEGITVSTQNAIVSIPLEGKVDPTYQYLGGMGTKATVKMKVIGERAIKHMREVFDNICTSSAKNRDAGVTGFLGLRNDLISVMGMKYAMVDSWSVATIEGYPHVYDVTLNMSDFDILQQKREQPSAPERLQMMENTTVGHPIMRMHQELQKVNAYPDLPLPRMMKPEARLVKTDKDFFEGLDVQWRTDKNKNPVMVPGAYLDPDFYYMRPKLDIGKKVDTTIKRTGDTVKSRAVDFTKYGGAIELRGMGKDFTSPFSLRTNDDDAKDPFNVLIAAHPQKYTAADVRVDSRNPQSVMNAQMTSDVLDKLNELGIDPFATAEQKLHANDWLAEARENIGDGSNGTITEEQIKALELLYGNDPTDSFRMQIQEDLDGTTDGMIRAFPTYMVYLIDEGGRLITYKLFDTFYGIQSLISADIMLDKEAPMDTAVLQFSNLYNKLSTPQWYSSYTMPAFIQNIYTTAWTSRQRVFGLTNELESVQITPGMRMQVRMGYSANPEALPVIFNGTVSEVTNGAVMTVVCQGDGAELARITGDNYKSNASTYSFLGTPMVEPQDLICRYMGAASSVWSQWLRRASIGMNPGDGTNGLAHFGAILWDTSMFGGDTAFKEHIRQTSDRIIGNLKRNTDQIATYLSKNSDPSTSVGKKYPDWFNACGSALGIFGDNAGDVVSQGFEDFQKLAEDFELIKRNVYPGNGSGYRRFKSGFALHNSPLRQVGNAIWGMLSPNYIDRITSMTGQDTDDGFFNERSFKVNTGGKTNWEIFKMCESLLPNYVLGVRMFNQRSTLFYGKQHWLYTSGVVPIFDAEGLAGYEMSIKSPIAESTRPTKIVESSTDKPTGATDRALVGDNSCIWIDQAYESFAHSWINEPHYADLKKVIVPVVSTISNDDFKKKYDEMLDWIASDSLLFYSLKLLLVEDPVKCPLYSLTSSLIKSPAAKSASLSSAGDRGVQIQRTLSEAEYVLSYLTNHNADKFYLQGSSSDSTRTVSTLYAYGKSDSGGRYVTKSICQSIIADMKQSMETPGGNVNRADNFRDIIERSDGAITSKPMSAIWLPCDASSHAMLFLKALWNTYTGDILAESPIRPVKVPYAPLTVPYAAGSQNQDAVIPAEETVKTHLKRTLEGYLWEHWTVDLNGAAAKSKYLDWAGSNGAAEQIVTGVGGIGGVAPDEARSKGPTGWVDTLVSNRHPHIIDASSIKEAIELLGTGKRPNFPLNSKNAQQTDLAPDGGTIQGGGDAKSAFGYLSTVMVGGIDELLDASYYNQSYAMAQWEALNDSAYYGMNANTDLDPYAGADLIKQGYKDPAEIDSLRLDMAFARGYASSLKILPADVLRKRKLEIACDNPFSREYGEPVLEVREPFSKMHYVTSERNLISNGIYADETNVANQIKAIAHTNSKNNAKKEVTVKADASIPAQLVREKIVDTGLNYEMWSWHDLESHKNMARKALKDSLQTMYGGELVICGDPKIRPFDFLFLWDTPNQTNGWCEVNRVTHHIGVDTGFTTSVSVAPIVVVDDAYLFGMFTSYYALQLDRVSKELIASNIAYGQFDTEGTQANYERENLQAVVQKTAAMVDGNAGSARTLFLVGSIIPAQAAAKKLPEVMEALDKIGKMSDSSGWEETWSGAFANLVASYLYRHGDKITSKNFVTICKDKAKEWAKKAVEQNVDVTQVAGYSELFMMLDVRTGEDKAFDDNLRAVVLTAAKQYVPIYQAKLKVEEINKFIENTNNANGVGTVKDVDLEKMETDQATAAQNMTATMMDYVQPGYAASWQVSGAVVQGAAAAWGITEAGSAVAGGIAAGAAAAEGGATAVGTVAAGVTTAGAGVAAAVPAIAIVALAGLAMYGIGVGINKLITYLAEQEPISIMLLNQKGQPLQAGLKGADGIMAGQPATLPVITDFTGMAFPADSDASKIWSKMGFSLEDGFRLKDSESLIKTYTMQQAIRGSGRLEQGFVEGIQTNKIIHAQIVKLHDGDTVTMNHTVEVGNGFDPTDQVRLKFIDAPEVDPKTPPGLYTDMFPGLSAEGSQWGAETVRDWLAKRLQSNTDKGSLTSRFSYHPTVKIIYNTMQPVDGYGRLLGIIVDRQSAGEYYERDDYLTSPQFDWLKHSINGEMLTDPEMRQWVAPFITFPGISQVNGQEASVGDVTGRYYNIQVTKPEEDY